MTKATIPALFKTFPAFGSRSLGFDNLFETLDRLTAMDTPAYPPYNITKTSDENYQITVAAAGFKKDEVTIEHNKQELVIKTYMVRNGDSDAVFIHHGLALRDFTLKFKIADDVEVADAKFEDGLLTVNLKHIVPEEDKPKLIPIL